MKLNKSDIPALIVFLSLIAFSVSCNDISKKDKIHCLVRGTVADTSYTRMLLIPYGQDLRVAEIDTIKVEDGKFAYDLYVDEVFPYQLISMEEHNNGAWFSCDFLAENGIVDITYYNWEAEKQPSLKSDAPLNREYLKYDVEVNMRFREPLRREKDSLKQIGQWESPRMMELKTLLETAQKQQEKDSLTNLAENLYKSGLAYTPQYYDFQKKSKKLATEYEIFEADYIRKNHSLVGLFMLMHKACENPYPRQNKTALPKTDSLIIALFTEEYRLLYPDHSMTKYLELWMQSRAIRIGGQYIDFTAPDLNGIPHTLSCEIGGKVALIDLWASWCGSCRRTSKSMKPIYERYKDKGFTIVGVAREYDRKDMERALKKDDYPWLNLLELQDENKIWSKYGADRAGGITILVDRKGVILSISPTADEVERILQEIL